MLGVLGSHVHLHAGPRSSLLLAQLLSAVAGCGFRLCLSVAGPCGACACSHTRPLNSDKPQGICLLSLVQVLSQLLGSCITMRNAAIASTTIL